MNERIVISAKTVLLALLVWAAIPSAHAQLTQRQGALLANNCVQCHSKPGLGAPLFGDAKAWALIGAKGEDAVLVNVVQGVGSMPPAGYCSACDTEDFRALIRAMSGASTTQEQSE